jgi:hypothetical protein
MNSNLCKKAFGIMKSIETMGEKEKLERPSESYGKNYNKLRNLVGNHNPELRDLLPPEVDIVDYGMDDYSNIMTQHNFSEIHTFCSEIFHLLESSIDPF